jgi:WD40 repeat protein
LNIVGVKSSKQNGWWGADQNGESYHSAARCFHNKSVIYPRFASFVLLLLFNCGSNAEPPIPSTVIRTLSRPEGLNVSPSGKKLCYAVDKKVHVFDVDDGKELIVVDTEDNVVDTVFASESTVVFSHRRNKNNRIGIVDIDGKKKIKYIRLGNTQYPEVLVPVPCATEINIIVDESGKTGYRLLRFDLKQGVEVEVAERISRLTACIAYRGDGKVFVTGNLLGRVLVFDQDRPDAPVSVPSRRSSVEQLCCSADAKIIAGRFTDGALRLWSDQGKIITPEALLEIKADLIALSSDGKMLAYSNDAGVRIVDVNTGAKIIDFGKQRAATVRLQFCSANSFAAASEDQQIRIWSLKRPKLK